MIMTRRGAALALMAAGLPALSGFTANAEQIADHEILCSLQSFPRMPNTSRVGKPSPQAVQAIDWITLSVGLPNSFEILRGTFKTGSIAYATIRGNKRYIVYDESILKWRLGAPNWLEAGILAHEIGHHLAGHTISRSGRQWGSELQADYFSGFVMARLGANLAAAASWTQIVGEHGSKSHPPRAMRIKAVSLGWKQAKKAK